MQLAQSPTARIGIGLFNFLPNKQRIRAIIDCQPAAAWLAAGGLQPHCKQLRDASGCCACSYEFTDCMPVHAHCLSSRLQAAALPQVLIAGFWLALRLEVACRRKQKAW